MPRIRKILFTLALLTSLLCPASVYVHPEKLKGIASEAVYAVCQDSTGAIWLNTGYGICCYDGQNVRIANRSSMSRNIVYNGGRHIYGVTYYGILHFDIISGKRTVLSNPGIEYRNCYLLADGDSVWVTSGSKDLFVSRQDSLVVAAEVPDHSLTNIVRYNSEELLVGTREGALMTWNGKTFQSRYTFNRPVSHLDRRTDLSFFVGFHNGGFAVLSPSLELKQMKVEASGEEVIPHLEVRAFSELPDGDALVGAADGLFRYTQDGRCIREEGGFPPGEPVWSIMRDRDDNIWVGSFYNGIYYHDSAFEAYASLLQPMDARIRQVSALAEDSRGDLWVFTDNYGMYRVGRNQTTAMEIPGGSHIKFQSALYDRARDGIWTGEFQGQLRYYDIRSGTWSTYRFELPGGAPFSESINSIYLRDGILYLGTTQGCFVFNPLAEKVISRKLFPSSRVIYSIAPYGSHSILMSGIGINIYDFDTDILETLKVPGNCQDVMSVGDTIYTCATGSGLYILDGNNNRQVIAAPHTDSYISHICSTGTGELLVSSRSGLSLLGTDGHVRGIFSTTGGLGLSSLRGGCFLHRRDGTILIGGKEGVIVYTPSAQKAGSPLRNPCFESISVDNERRSFDERLPFLKEITLKPGERNFAVTVGTFSYSSVRPSFWRYKLEGNDKSWTTFDPSSPIVYMNVPAGDYRLTLQYDETPSFQNARATSLDIHLRSHWYATKRAKALYVLLALALVSAALYFLFSSMMFRQRLQYEEQESRRRTKLFVDISRQLRTPLTLIMGQLDTFISRYGSSAPGMKYIESSVSSANSMNDIISSFVDLENKFEPIQPPHELHPDNPPATVPAETDHASPRRHETQMLVVSDNPEMRALLRSVFGNSYNILSSPSASEALKVAMQEQPDIIVCDLMPDSSNEIKLVEEIRRNFETCHIPFVLITSHASEQWNLQSVRSGVDAFITKPFKTELLVASCRSLLENRRILRDKYALVPSGKTSDIRKEDYNFLNAAIGAVERNLYSGKLNVSTLCTELNMSKTSLTGKLHAVTNLSPRDFIEDIRLRHAAEMLQEGRLRVSEIADELGFSSAKYFTIRFKKRFGKSPSTYAGRMG